MRRTPEQRLKTITRRSSNGCLRVVNRRLDKTGRPSIVVDGVKLYCSIFAYQLAHGEIPKGHIVSQTCRDRTCVLGEHLVAITRSQAMQNAVAHGGIKTGEKSKLSKLSLDQVASIRSLSAMGKSSYAIAKFLDLPRWTVYNVVAGKTWKQEREVS